MDKITWEDLGQKVQITIPYEKAEALFAVLAETEEADMDYEDIVTVTTVKETIEILTEYINS